MASHIEYLVKPYGHSKDLPIDGCAKMEVPPFAHNPFIGILEKISDHGLTADWYLDRMLTLGKERVGFVAANPDSLFVMVDIFGDDSDRSTELIELRNFAIQKLGDRFTSLQSGYKTSNYLYEQGHLNHELMIHAYGEISDRCAFSETNELVRNIKETNPKLCVGVIFNNKLCPDMIDGKF